MSLLAFVANYNKFALRELLFFCVAFVTKILIIFGYVFALESDKKLFKL